MDDGDDVNAGHMDRLQFAHFAHSLYWCLGCVSSRLPDWVWYDTWVKFVRHLNENKRAMQKKKLLSNVRTVMGLRVGY
jgi:hypothetical protein